MTNPIIVLFRQDLRLQDHAALCAAVRAGQPVVPGYILDDDNAGQWLAGGASRWWLHHSLDALSESIIKLGGNLVLRRGDTVEEILKLANETAATAVFWSRGYEPFQVLLEKRLHDALNTNGFEAKRFSGTLLFEPDEIRNQSDEPFKVFTPFWKTCLRHTQPRTVTDMPDEISFFKKDIASDNLADWKLLPTKPNWAKRFNDYWTPGEHGGQQSLNQFLDDCVNDYKNQRDFPGRWGTSRLSPHLHFGELSPHQIWHAGQRLSAQEPRLSAGIEAYLRQIVWREFASHLLFHWPTFPQRPFREQFKNFPWHEDETALRAWQQGVTGYPIVDAGMRELWQTGWMHNRVRMITASFLVKHLLIPWQQGEDWFWDTLVDADLANNAAGWQWVAGCGADAAPYFRIFNPTLQGIKFDANGDYVRRWVPELTEIPNKHIHSPWDAPENVLRGANVTLGENYPTPIVDHQYARQRALDAHQQLKSSFD